MFPGAGIAAPGAMVPGGLAPGAVVPGAVDPGAVLPGAPCSLVPRCSARRLASSCIKLRAAVEVRRVDVRPRVSDVRKNTTASAVEARVKNVAAPLPPKSVWLEPAPNAPASPPPLPD